MSARLLGARLWAVLPFTNQLGGMRAPPGCVSTLCPGPRKAGITPELADSATRNGREYGYGPWLAPWVRAPPGVCASPEACVPGARDEPLHCLLPASRPWCLLPASLHLNPVLGSASWGSN